MDIVKQLGKTVFFSVIISLFGNEICKSCPYLCFLRGGKKLRWGGRLEQMKRGKKLTSVQINFFSIHLLYNFISRQGVYKYVRVFCFIGLMIFSEGGIVVDFDHKES